MNPLLGILAALMFGVAAVFSMLGQGGGVLYTPLQVFFGIKFHVAATTSLFLIMVTSLSATLVFHKGGKVDWPLAIALESATTLGGLAGGLSSGRFSGVFLSLLFAAVVGAAGVFMIRSFGTLDLCPPEDTAGLWHWRRRFREHHYCVNLLVALPASFIAGVISGLVGVGGGIIKVPLMVLLLGIPMDIAVGSSALMIGLTASAGFAGHLIAGHWDWKLSLLLAVAVFAGGQIGSRKALGVDRKKMKRIFGWFMLVIAAAMIARVCW